MKISLHVLITMTLMALTACSTQEIRPDTKSITVSPKSPIVPDQSAQSSGQNPALTLIENNKTLNLVRIMDGGACKNDFQGVKGAFLVYADSADIERIKREKGAQVFNDFEKEIQAFSTAALQKAINATNLAEDPFALGADQAQEKLASQLANNFRSSIADAVNGFQKTTTMTIDILPFAPSFIFYQQGCEAMHLEPDN